MPPRPDTQIVTRESRDALCLTTEMPYARLFYLCEAESVCLLEILRQCVSVEGNHSEHFKLSINVNIVSVKFIELISSSVFGTNLYTSLYEILSYRG
jgi:hypothetical protein